MCVCVCVCVCARARVRYAYTHTPTNAYGHEAFTCKDAEGRVETAIHLCGDLVDERLGRRYKDEDAVLVARVAHHLLHRVVGDEGLA